jgi:hypothetical protein
MQVWNLLCGTICHPCYDVSSGKPVKPCYDVYGSSQLCEGSKAFLLLNDQFWFNVFPGTGPDFQNTYMHVFLNEPMRVRPGLGSTTVHDASEQQVPSLSESKESSVVSDCSMIRCNHVGHRFFFGSIQSRTWSLGVLLKSFQQGQFGHE